MPEYALRRILPADDAAVAALIRTVMPEFGAVGDGFAINDPEVSAMAAAYAGERAGYWVLLQDGRVVGGGGFAPLLGGGPTVCELRKMYALPEARGRGQGARLLERILAGATEAGFTTCYLETLEHMHAARKLYLRFGFEALDAPLGATGHHGCNAWFARGLGPTE